VIIHCIWFVDAFSANHEAADDTDIKSDLDVCFNGASSHHACNLNSITGGACGSGAPGANGGMGCTGVELMAL